jgi:hypothetical protein
MPEKGIRNNEKEEIWVFFTTSRTTRPSQYSLGKHILNLKETFF